MKAKKRKTSDPADDGLAKLVNLTKLMKAKNIKVARKGPAKEANKWRAAEPKFDPKPSQPSDTVEAGGMQVAPERAEEYENWRKDRIAEQEERRATAKRRAKNAQEARKARE